MTLKSGNLVEPTSVLHKALNLLLVFKSYDTLKKNCDCTLLTRSNGGRERGGGERRRETKVRERENLNSNSKTLFYKDCSLGLVKNLSNN